MGHQKKGDKEDKRNKAKIKSGDKYQDDITKKKKSCKYPYVLCNINIGSNNTIYISLSRTCNQLFI